MRESKIARQIFKINDQEKPLRRAEKKKNKGGEKEL